MQWYLLIIMNKYLLLYKHCENHDFLDFSNVFYQSILIYTNNINEINKDLIYSNTPFIIKNVDEEVNIDGFNEELNMFPKDLTNIINKYCLNLFTILLPNNDIFYNNIDKVILIYSNTFANANKWKNIHYQKGHLMIVDT